MITRRKRTAIRAAAREAFVSYLQGWDSYGAPDDHGWTDEEYELFCAEVGKRIGAALRRLRPKKVRA